MKRLHKALAGFLLFPAIFISCGEEEEAINSPLSTSSETLQGEFDPIGSVGIELGIDIEPTHLFEAEDGTVYYAYSNNLELSDSEYKEGEFEVYGSISFYENVSKGIFEVRMITPLGDEEKDNEDEEDDTDSEMQSYTSQTLGISFSYPEDWTLNSYEDSLQIQAPEDSAQGGNYIILASLGEVSGLSEGNTESETLQAVKAYVTTYYGQISEVTPSTQNIGKDGEFAVRYALSNGTLIYLIPRGKDLYEISFYVRSEENSSSSEFIQLLNSVDFTTSSSNDSEETIELTPIDGYEELESPYLGFSILYPDTYYYMGDITGYSFSDEPLDEGGKAILRVELSSTGTEGTSQEGNQINITVKVDDTYYTLTGPEDFTDVLQTMADSITPSKP